jgi:hypothetical protein
MRKTNIFFAVIIFFVACNHEDLYIGDTNISVQDYILNICNRSVGIKQTNKFNQIRSGDK